ncbi:hypothetical protein [Caproiciproducens sp. LBM24188]|nr:hypothetical protein [Oscillospiraceae bacterium]HHV31045.1 hypothetical protein [Clostridiales bacterium]
MELSYNGFGESTATFAVTDGVTAEMPVKMTANGTVGACAAGDKFCGVALNTRGGYAAVQLSGYVRLPYTGTAPAIGYGNFSAAGENAIQIDAAGRELLVLDVDETGKTCGVIL